MLKCQRLIITTAKISLWALLVLADRGAHAQANKQSEPAQETPTMRAPSPPDPSSPPPIDAKKSTAATIQAMRAMSDGQAASEAAARGETELAKTLSNRSTASAKSSQTTAEDSGDPDAAIVAGAAGQVARMAEQSVTQAENRLCGKGRRDFPKFLIPCIYAGAFLASASMTGMKPDKSLHQGQTTRTIVSAVIPAAGLRWSLDRKGHLSLEIGALSMLASKDLSASKTRKGCRRADGDFEKHLPCEGDVAITPLLAGYMGLTVGTDDIGLFTLMPMVGIASTSLDNGRYYFRGIAIGLISLSKIVNLGR